MKQIGNQLADSKEDYEKTEVGQLDELQTFIGKRKVKKAIASKSPLDFPQSNPFNLASGIMNFGSTEIYVTQRQPT